MFSTNKNLAFRKCDFFPDLNKFFPPTLFYCWSNVIISYFQATVQAHYIVRAQVVQMISSATAKIFLIYTEADLICFSIVATLDCAVFAIGLVTNYNRSLSSNQPSMFERTRSRYSTHIAKKLLREAWPLAPGFIL